MSPAEQILVNARGRPIQSVLLDLGSTDAGFLPFDGQRQQYSVLIRHRNGIIVKRSTQWTLTLDAHGIISRVDRRDVFTGP